MSNCSYCVVGIRCMKWLFSMFILLFYFIHILYRKKINPQHKFFLFNSFLLHHGFCVCCMWKKHSETKLKSQNHANNNFLTSFYKEENNILSLCWVCCSLDTSILNHQSAHFCHVIFLLILFALSKVVSTSKESFFSLRISCIVLDPAYIDSG